MNKIEERWVRDDIWARATPKHERSWVRDGPERYQEIRERQGKISESDTSEKSDNESIEICEDGFPSAC